VTGFDQAAVDRRVEERPVLARQVVTDHDHIHDIPGFVEEETEPVQPVFQGLVEQRLAEFRRDQEVLEPLLQPTEVPAGFVDDTGDAADDSVGRLFPEDQGPLAQALEPAGSSPFGQG
jgi:hypothetical protein